MTAKFANELFFNKLPPSKLTANDRQYPRNPAVKFDGIKHLIDSGLIGLCKCIVEIKFMRNIFNDFISSCDDCFWHALYVPAEIGPTDGLYDQR